MENQNVDSIECRYHVRQSRNKADQTVIRYREYIEAYRTPGTSLAKRTFDCGPPEPFGGRAGYETGSASAEFMYPNLTVNAMCADVWLWNAIGCRARVARR